MQRLTLGERLEVHVAFTRYIEGLQVSRNDVPFEQDDSGKWIAAAKSAFAKILGYDYE
jgi:hypothetical protein